MLLLNWNFTEINFHSLGSKVKGAKTVRLSRLISANLNTFSAGKVEINKLNMVYSNLYMIVDYCMDVLDI